MADEAKSNEHNRYLGLYKAIDSGNLKATKEFLDKNPEALTAPLTPENEKPLHIAVLAGHTEIVEEIVKRMMDLRSVEIKNDDGVTPLFYAATAGTVRIAKCLVTNYPGLLSIANNKQCIPVMMAALYGHRDMIRYLYSVTPVKELDPAVHGNNRALFVTTCILDGLFDIALSLIRRYPQLAYMQDTDGDTALGMLARSPKAFPSGTHFQFWQWWIYSHIPVGRPSSSSDINDDIERPREGQADRMDTITRGFRWLQQIWWTGLKFVFPFIKHLYELKLKHVQAQELLSCICQQVFTVEKSECKEKGVYDAMFRAVENGIVEFVAEMIKQYPDIIYAHDKDERNIFLLATRQRQEKVFSLIYKTGAKKSLLAAEMDKYENNMLHQAAFLAPSSQLDLVPGAVLQMQRELQWFKEVKSLVQPRSRELVNNVPGNARSTPQALFTEEHKDLVKQGEEWMKTTAESCTVVAALVATMMFSAAFTIPGGYDNSGMPLYLYRNSFIVYIVSDAISLFTSTTSILMFLGILKSRYKEQDFLVSLPTKLILGLSMLFLSIASMMVTFGVTLMILLQERIQWVVIPVILLISISVGLFVVLQFPLLFDIVCSTYGPGIFDKPRKYKTS